MTTFHNDDDTTAKASLSNLQASRIPMMQRMNQQFLIESKFQDYNDDIVNLGSKSQTMLHSIEVLESRLKSMRTALHLHPSIDDAHSSSSISSPTGKMPPESSTPKGDIGASCVVKSRGNNDVTSQKLNQQHNISIHYRKRQSQSRHGRGDVPSSTSSTSSEKYDGRRSQFLFRIASIEQSIERLEEIRDGIPAKQAYLTQQMQRLQQRIVLLVSEIERVAPFDSSAFVTSHVLHDACAQTFTKRQLVRRLRMEETKSRNYIASSRLEAINLMKSLDNLTADINKKKEHLNERKSALLHYDKQQATVSKMRMAVSKQPKELKSHYLSLWRREALERRKVRDTLASVATVISRQLCAKAWKHWIIRLDSGGSYQFTSGEEGGIGTGDLLLQEARLMDNIEEGAAIVRKLKSDALEGRDLDAGYDQTNFLAHENENNYLKGEFLFNVKQYEAALRCYERVEAVMSSGGYLRDETTASGAIELYAKVTNKIGQIHLRVQSINLAIVYFGRQLSLAQEEGLEVQRIEALIGLSECYIQKHDFKYACDFLQQCLPLIISGCDKEMEKVVYALLQKCYEHLNNSEEAAFCERKIHDMRDTRAERVEAAFERMDTLRQRLIDVSASNSRLVQAQACSAKSVSLAKQLKAKEKDVSDSKEAIKESRDFLSQLIELEGEIRAEIDAATNAKKNRIISFRLHDSSQEIKKKELLFRLNEKLNITEMKQEECRNDLQSLERTIRNLNDDISQLHEEIALEERPLIERVIGQRRYRCVALNTSNTVHGNVSGVGNGGANFVAMSNGKECYVHNISSGELETVFMGDVEGQHVGPLIGHTATITAVFFYGKRVYTGSLDSSIICWDVDSTAKLFQSKGHEGAVTCIFYDGTKAISGGADKTIIHWSPDGILLHRISGHVGGVHHIQCCLSCFASSSFESVFVWDLIHQQESEDRITRVKCRQRLTLPQGNVSTLYLLGESELITGDSIGYLKVWNIQSAEALTSVKVHEGAVTSLQADATKAVSCGLDMLIHITDIIQGSVLQTLRGHDSPIFAVAFDQRQIVSVSSDGEIRFWSWGSS